MDVRDDLARLRNAFEKNLGEHYPFGFGRGGSFDGPAYDLTDAGAAKRLFQVASESLPAGFNCFPFMPDVCYLTLRSADMPSGWLCLEKFYDTELASDVISFKSYIWKGKAYAEHKLACLMTPDCRTQVTYEANIHPLLAESSAGTITALTRVIACLTVRPVRVDYLPASPACTRLSKRLVAGGKKPLDLVRKISLGAIQAAYPQPDADLSDADLLISPQDRTLH